MRTAGTLKHLFLRAFLAGNLPKKLSKVGVLNERGMKKSKKTLHNSEVRATFAVKTHNLHHLEFISASPRIPRFPRKRRSGPLLGASLHHARWPGWRELNKPPQIMRSGFVQVFWLCSDPHTTKMTDEARYTNDHYRNYLLVGDLCRCFAGAPEPSFNRWRYQRAK